MAKGYSKMRRTGKYQRRKRTNARVTNSLRPRAGLNTMSLRFFPKLPNRMQVAIPSYGDTIYNMFAGVGAIFSDNARAAYFWIDAINPELFIGALAGASRRYMFSPQFKQLMTLYGEARLRTTVLNYEFSGEFSKTYGAAATPQELAYEHNPQFHLAVCTVPLSYLKDSAGAQHTVIQAGSLFFDMDYYSAVSQLPGCKTYVIPLTGDRPPIKGSCIVDGYEHTGSTIVANSAVTWPAQGIGFPTVVPTSIITYNQGTQRNVILIAMRIRGVSIGNTSQVVQLRASYKMDQHYTLVDPMPLQPVVPAVGAAVNEVA